MNKIIKIIIGIALIGLFVLSNSFAQSVQKLGSASYSFSDSVISISTGKVERKWKWTGHGFLTQSFKNLISNEEWASSYPNHHVSDWHLPTKIEKETGAKLISVNCNETDDEQFTSKHLLVTAHIKYDTGLEIQFLIRVYPNASGVWTALNVKADETFNPEGIPEDLAIEKYYGSRQAVKIARGEYIPIDFSKPNRRRYWGLYNDPGNRVNTKDMVKEEVKTGFPLFWDEQNTWASGLAIEREEEGLILVKESNKTVNNYGHQTGAFYCTPKGVEVTGWGLKPQEITTEFRQTWATWSILYSGGEDEMELALKQFDRTRYPVNLDRDMHILIDTWGSDFQNGDYEKLYGRQNSAFSVVEKEIQSAGEIGIDIVRIDDGWQEGKTKSKDSWHPNPNVGYSENWEKVKALSKKHNVRIGLWAAIRYISEKELFTNQQELNVATWKFDFDKLENWENFNTRVKDIRKFIRETGYTTQTAWCPEYDDPRYGWYSAARECGPMYFQNIQNNLPNHIVYVPYITLKHHWMMSRFYNVNDLQCNWQNPALTNKEFSDAHLHSQSYAAFSAFMGAPTAFMLTQFLTKEQRNALKELVSIYKDHRKKMFESFVFPIGSQPDNASWAGFQFYNPEKNSGYLMIFRERLNTESEKEIKLRFLKDTELKIQNLESSNGAVSKKVGKEGELTFQIDKPADYLFLKYEVEDK